MAKAKAHIIPFTPAETIVSKIYYIRDQKVMLDFDLAALYGVETKRLNEQVKRNIERFPEDFMFRLTAKEWSAMMSQFATSPLQTVEIQKKNRSQIATASQKNRNLKVTPYAFTEHGVTMLASVLKSEQAIKMSMAVVRAFIELKKLATDYSALAGQIEALKLHLGEDDVQLNSIYEAIENLLDDKVEQQSLRNRKRIGFRPDE